jgi:hypothetical protein
MKPRLLLGVCAVLALAVWGASASADPTQGPPICNPQAVVTPISGTYGNLTITGNRYVAAGTALTVTGNLTIADGSCLDAFTLGTVTVGGNVKVDKGAILGLGCSPGALGMPFDQAPCDGMTTTDTVGGNIIANQPLTMYLTADTVRGNVISNGGGPGLALDAPYTNFPIKEMNIGGNLIVQGWEGAWSGALRNTVGGNLIYSKNISAINDDSNEVDTNIIGGNLICQGNSPAVQFGDSMGTPNTVGGKKIGQCTAV